MLSKITHLAVVLPVLDRKFIKKLENILYEFIWKGRDLVAREDAKKGNYGRLHKTKAAWGNIFMEYIKEINPILTLDDLFANSGTFDLLTLQKYQVKLLEGSNCSS